MNRLLQVYLRDPSLPAYRSGVGTISIPFERWNGGQSKRFNFKVVLGNGRAPNLKLDNAEIVASQGLRPSIDSEDFAAQMVYGVAMLTLDRFQRILGRRSVWRGKFEADGTFGETLTLRTNGEFVRNAYYDPVESSVVFGWSKHKDLDHDDEITVRTALSFDVIVHELTHAVIDGLFPELLDSKTSAAGALHEGIADLVAIFVRFTQTELLKSAIAKDGVDLDSKLLINIAEQFGHMITGSHRPLRCAILDTGDINSRAPDHARLNAFQEPHDQGAVLVTAVFLAFRTIYKSKIKTLLEASNGLSNEAFQALAAQHASRLAEQFLAMIVRALDYLAPGNPSFVDYYHAIIWADEEFLVSDDWNYREIITQAFRRHQLISSHDANPLKNDVPTLELPELLVLSPRPADFDKIEHWCQTKAKQLTPFAETDAEPARLGCTPVLTDVQRALRAAPDQSVRLQYFLGIKWQLPGTTRSLASTRLVFNELGELTRVIHSRALNSMASQDAEQLRQKLKRLHGLEI